MAAEAAGFDQVVLSEHVALPAVVDGHPGARPGDPPSPFPFPADEEYPEPLVTLAAMAAATTRIRLSTNILIAPLRPAVLLAKQVATLAVLSDDRLDLGVGTGWQSDEFAAHGLRVHEAGQRLEDAIRACRALWTGTPSTLDAPTVRFRDMICRPAPTERVPVWFGGSAGRRTARRVAELGDGWSVIGGTPLDDVRRGRQLIEEAFGARGRDRASLAVRCSIPYARTSRGECDVAATLDAAHAAIDAGATVIQVGATVPGVDPDDPLAGITAAAEVVAPLAGPRPARSPTVPAPSSPAPSRPAPSTSTTSKSKGSSNASTA